MAKADDTSQRRRGLTATIAVLSTLTMVAVIAVLVAHPTAPPSALRSTGNMTEHAQRRQNAQLPTPHRHDVDSTVQSSAVDAAVAESRARAHARDNNAQHSLLVLRPDGQPAQGCPARFIRRSLRSFSDSRDLSHWLSEGPATLTDNNGYASIPSPLPGNANAVIEHDGTVGWADTSTLRGDRPTLRLVRDLDVQVGAVLEDGSPSALPWIQWSMKTASGSSISMRIPSSKKTLIDWPHCGLVLSGWRRPDNDPVIETKLRAVAGQVTLGTLTIPRAPLDGDRFSLRLTGIGSLDVALVDTQGHAVLDVQRTRLEALDPISREPTTIGWTWDAGVSRPRPGHLLFSQVPFGLQCRVAIDSFGFRTVYLDVAGPTLSQPAVRATLTLPPQLKPIVGQLVGHPAPAEPGQDQWIGLSREASPILGSAKLQDDGRFNFLVAVDASSNNANCKLNTAGGRISLLLDLSGPERIDLGRITLDAQPLLVSGSVILSPDAPCDGFNLWTEQRAPGAEVWRRAGVAIELNGTAFVARGQAAPGEYRICLSPHARCHIPPRPLPFVPGTDDVEIQLERGHTLGLRMRLPGDEDARFIDAPHADNSRVGGIAGLRLELRPTGGDALTQVESDRERGVPLSGNPRRNGDTSVRYWNGLANGSYQLEVLSPTGRRLALSPHIEIPSQQTIEIDLRDRCTTARLRVTDHRDAPLEGVRYWQLKSGTDAIAHRSVMPIGSEQQFIIPDAAEPIDLLLYKAGYAPAKAINLREDRHITLSPCSATLEVSLVNVPAIRDGAELRVIAFATGAVPDEWSLPSDVLRHDATRLGMRRQQQLRHATIETLQPGTTQCRLALPRIGIFHIEVETLDRRGLGRKTLALRRDITIAARRAQLAIDLSIPGTEPDAAASPPGRSR